MAQSDPVSAVVQELSCQGLRAEMAASARPSGSASGSVGDLYSDRLQQDQRREFSSVALDRL